MLRLEQTFHSSVGRVVLNFSSDLSYHLKVCLLIAYSDTPTSPWRPHAGDRPSPCNVAAGMARKVSPADAIITTHRSGCKAVHQEPCDTWTEVSGKQKPSPLEKRGVLNQDKMSKWVFCRNFQKNLIYWALKWHFHCAWQLTTWTTCEPPRVF